MLFPSRCSLTLTTALGLTVCSSLGLSGCSREIQLAGGGAGGAQGSSASVQAGLSASAASGQSTSPNSSSTSVHTGSASVTSTTSGGPGMGDVFDPNEMYFTGYINNIGNYFGIAHWSSIDNIMTGFPDSFLDGVIRPADGRFIYPMVGPEIREFHCDACPFQGTYPSDPLANDPTFSVAPCTNGILMLLSPEGNVLHNCAIWGDPWYDANGNSVFQKPEGMLVHLGYDGIAVTNMGDMFDLTTSTDIPTTGLPPFVGIAYRALPPPDAFLVVLPRTSNRAQDGSQDLWKLDRMGVGTKLGELAPVPPGVMYVYPEASIDGHGAVFQPAYTTGQNMIIRRTITGESSIVITDVDQHLLTVQPFAFATGP